MDSSHGYALEGHMQAVRRPVPKSYVMYPDSVGHGIESLRNFMDTLTCREA